MTTDPSTAPAKTVVLGCNGVGAPPSTNNAPTDMFAAFVDAVQAIYGNNKVECPYHFDQVNWPSSFGPVGSADFWSSDYRTNLATGIGEAREVVEDWALHMPVILWGYSGGAQVVTSLIETEYSTGANPNVTGLYVVANPLRRAGDSYPAWYGIVGQHTELNMPVEDFANPADVIACCPADSPLRDLYGLVDRFSLSDPVAWAATAIDYVTQGLLHGTLQSPTASAVDWFTALAYLRGYLFDGQHTTWYTDRIGTAASNFIAKFDQPRSLHLTRDFAAPRPRRPIVGHPTV